MVVERVLNGSSVVGGSTVATLNTLAGYDFINSPEWICRHTERGSDFDVQIRAENTVRILNLNLKQIDTLLTKNFFLEAAINSIVGVDLARKSKHIDI